MDLQKIIEDTISQSINKHFEALFLRLAQPAKDELLSIDETASLLKVSKPTIHRFMNDGRLHFKKIGSRTFFKQSVVQKFAGIE